MTHPGQRFRHKGMNMSGGLLVLLVASALIAGGVAKLKALTN